MSRLLYDLTVKGYFLAVRLSSPFLPKAKKLHRGQSSALDTIRRGLAENTAPVAWFHCASLGEFEQGRPVLEAFKRTYPSYKVLLTFFSPSGFEVRKDYAEADVVAYLPRDTRANARTLYDITKPRIAFFIKSEFWYHHLHELVKRDIPIIGVSCTFRPDQVYFNKGSLYIRNVLRNYNALFVQNEKSYDLLKDYRFNNMILSKDTRFDRVSEVCQGHRNLPQIERFKSAKKLLVIGSSWPADLKVIAPALKGGFEELKVIIAPHDISESQIKLIEKQMDGKRSIRYSSVSDGGGSLEESDVLIIDNIGMLTSLYKYADVSYIGGAFKEGLHNILEPAVFGNPVIFGPYHDKFPEAQRLISKGGAFSISSTESFRSVLNHLLSESDLRSEAGDACRLFIQENVGATDQIMDYIQELLHARKK